MAEYWARASGKRAELWRELIGADVVPITSGIPTAAKLPIGWRPVFFLDLTRVDLAILPVLAAGLGARFGMSIDEIAEELPRGVPVLADRRIAAAVR